MHLYSSNPTCPPPSVSNVMPPSLPVEQFSPNKEKTDSGILWPSCPSHSLKQSGIMISMTESYWLSSELWKNGGITSKDPLIQWRSSLITRIWKCSEKHENCPIVRPDGPSSSLISIFILLMSQGRQQGSLMPCPAERTIIRRAGGNVKCDTSLHPYLSRLQP